MHTIDNIIDKYILVAVFIVFLLLLLLLRMPIILLLLWLCSTSLFTSNLFIILQFAVFFFIFVFHVIGFPFLVYKKKNVCFVVSRWFIIWIFFVVVYSLCLDDFNWAQSIWNWFVVIHSEMNGVCCVLIYMRRGKKEEEEQTQRRKKNRPLNHCFNFIQLWTVLVDHVKLIRNL